MEFLRDFRRFFVSWQRLKLIINSANRVRMNRGCAWDCAAPTHGLVPGGACKIGELAGDSSAADGAPIAARQAAGCGTEPARRAARLSD
jgi:hypothetical protein